MGQVGRKNSRISKNSKSVLYCTALACQSNQNGYKSKLLGLPQPESRCGTRNLLFPCRNLPLHQRDWEEKSDLRFRSHRLRCPLFPAGIPIFRQRRSLRQFCPLPTRIQLPRAHRPHGQEVLPNLLGPTLGSNLRPTGQNRARHPSPWAGDWRLADLRELRQLFQSTAFNVQWISIARDFLCRPGTSQGNAEEDCTWKLHGEKFSLTSFISC